MTLCMLLLLALPLLASLAYLLAVAFQVDHLEREAERRHRRDAAAQVRIVRPPVRVELPLMPVMPRPVAELLPPPAPTSPRGSARGIGSAPAAVPSRRLLQAVLQRRESLN